jgi:hypothetical protein
MEPSSGTFLAVSIHRQVGILSGDIPDVTC